MLPAPSQSFLKIRFSVKGNARLLFLMFAYRQQKVCPPCFLLSSLQTSAKSQNLLKFSISTTDIGIILIQLKALSSAIKNSLRWKQKPESKTTVENLSLWISPDCGHLWPTQNLHLFLIFHNFQN